MWGQIFDFNTLITTAKCKRERVSELARVVWPEILLENAPRLLTYFDAGTIENFEKAIQFVDACLERQEFDVIFGKRAEQRGGQCPIKFGVQRFGAGGHKAHVNRHTFG